MAQASDVEKSMNPELWETPEGWERLKPLFGAAMQKPPEERVRFAEEVCGDDLELREALLRLLRANEDSIGRGDGPILDLHSLFPPAKPAFAEDEVVLGRFRIVRPIGSGGMGEVYEALDLELGRIALKTILPEIAGNPQILARFRREVQLARKIGGPHVCRIHDLHLSTDAAGRPRAFLTMEFLDGITLADKVREWAPLPWREVKQIALEICEGLRVMHEAGIIHRDLKSRNVMLASRNGVMRAVVMDFGLAREVRSATTETATDVSAEHAIVGTIEYMAPEQFEGNVAGAATDIYALGVILHELATGDHPFAAQTPVGAAIRRAKHFTPASKGGKVPKLCDRVIERCLEYEPERRFQSANEVAKALQANPANLANLRKDRPWILRAVGALVVAAIVWAGFQAWQWWQYDHPNAEAQKLYDGGLAALREGSYVKATRLLTSAIDSDSHFPMAHARLAEAWANLDFDGKSTQEMLIAFGGEHHLRPLDSLYLHAIHATLTRDYAGAVLLYRKILDHLPDDKTQRAAGYVDLGMAYERAGDPTHANESYRKSESMDSDNPAPYMHEAILDTRLHKVPEADKAFARAEGIFTRGMNQEGQAELDYERGYEANQEGDSEQADRFLNRSLEEAKQIEDVQLEIRDYTQLSSVACASGRIAEAASLAQSAIQQSRTHQLDAWAAMGLVRLAYAQTYEGSEHFQEAEGALNEALALAGQSQQGRAEALANVALANLRDQQHRWDEVIAPATAALKYYTQHGYFEGAAKATLLILRAQQGKGDFEQSLRAANDFWSLAEKSGNKDQLMHAEAELATTYQSAERYPEALSHFQRAVTLADNETDRADQAMSTAEVLLKLGRFAEAETLLRTVTDRSLAASVNDVRLDALLSQQRYGVALALTNTWLSGKPEIIADIKEEFEYKRAVAEAHLHKNSVALAHLEAAATNNGDSPDERWQMALLAAEVEMLCAPAQKARDHAIAAEQYFASRGQLDSELHAALFVVITSRTLNDKEMINRYSIKVIDIRSALEHNWDPETFHTYSSRPDVRTLMRVFPPQGSRMNGS